MARLSLSFLGGCAVALDGAPAPRFAREKARALLAYLALESDRAHARSELAALFWPEQGEESARTNLRQTLAALRDALGDEAASAWLETTHETIRFLPSADVMLDVAAFRRLASPTADERALVEALALYRGELLAGVEVRDSPAWDDWLARQREGLRREAVSALGRLAGQLEERGDLAEALAQVWRALALAPWDESAHQRAMRLLARQGDRAGALAQYEACRRALRDELGAEPAPETEALRDDIRDGRLAPRPEPRALNLPASLFPLVGREEELSRLIACLRDPGCRLLTVVGPGGAGKTRLAVEAGRLVAGDYRDGLCYVPLSAVQDPAGIGPAMAQALGFTPYQGAPLAEQLLSYLRGRRVLLLLDSYEHLLEGAAWNAAPLVSDILTAAPGVKALVTSRARLNLPGEQIFPLAGLALGAEPQRPSSFPSPNALGEGAGGEGSPAAALFATAAQRVRPGYALTDADAPAVAAICQRVEGMPLAILLAASWMGLLTAEEVAAQVAPDSGRGIEFLAADWPGLPERERSMAATLERSWSLLSQREQGVLAGLSAFCGGFTAEGAAAVAGATLRDLARLADRSLLYRRESGRYDLHDLLREYAALKLRDAPDGGESVRDRHGAHYLGTLAGWSRLFTGADEAVAEIDAEWENVRAAWTWAVRRGEWTLLGAATRALTRYSSTRYCHAEVRALLLLAEERIREVLAAPAARTGPLLHAAGAIIAARAYQDRMLGRPQAAMAPLREGIALLEEAIDAGEDARGYLARNVRRLAWMLSPAESAESMRCYDRAIQLARETADREELADALNFSGGRARNMGDLPEARRRLGEALVLRRALGNVSNEIQCLSQLVYCALEERDGAAAERWLEEARTVVQRVGIPKLPPKGRSHFRLILHILGHFEEAAELSRDQLLLFRERGLEFHLLGGLETLGNDELMAGGYAEARAHLEESLRLYQAAADALNVQNTCLSLGQCALGQGDLAEAERWLERLTHDPPDPKDTYHLTCLLGAPVASLAGREGEARRYLCEALRHGSAMQSLPAVALYLALRGEAERAVEVYALACGHPWVGNSRWHEDVFGRPIAAAAASLPPEAIRAAQERGRARDPQATAKELLAELEA